MNNHRISHRARGGRLRSACALAAALAVASVASSCQSLLLWSQRSDSFSPAQQSQIGVLAWQEWSNAHQPVRDERQLEVVRRVGQRLASASGRSDLQWQFDVVVDPTPQVVAFPGGKVVVSDALLGVCENEGLLAAAMAHQMGHMLGGHGLERLHHHESQPENSGSSPPMPAAAFAAGDPAQTRPYSPRHESEADSIALSLMVRAGYDPESAHTFWTRVAAEQSSAQFSGLARLHAVGGDRLRQLDSSLAQARVMYRSFPGQIGVGAALAFEIHHDPPATSTRPTPDLTPVPHAASSLWAATSNRGAAKPDTWNSDLQPSAPATLMAHEAGPRLPPERPIQQASFDTPDEEEWLTPIVRPSE